MQSQYMNNRKLLTIISASNRPHHMAAFFENLKETLRDPGSLEVLVKIDDGDDAMRQLLEDAIKNYAFEIRYIQTPRLDGYYTLHLGYQKLWEISDPNTYFILPVNEEVRFKTLHWDDVLRNYVGLYADDFFRLKISRLKYRNYYSYHDCGPCPENYPILTRKWMELAEGIGDCWGPDGWHQFIDYHLGMCPGVNDVPGIFRSVPILDILIANEEAGKELTKEQIKVRTLRVCREWWRMYSPPLQQGFRRLAIKMMSYVWAKNLGLNKFLLEENKKHKSFFIMHEGRKIGEFYYYLSPNYIRFKNFGFLVNMARKDLYGFLRAYIFHANMPKNFLLRYLDRLVRIIAVLSAVLISFFVCGFESTPRSLLGRFKARMKQFLRKTLQHTIGYERTDEVAKFYKKIRKKHAV